MEGQVNRRRLLLFWHSLLCRVPGKGAHLILSSPASKQQQHNGMSENITEIRILAGDDKPREKLNIPCHFLIFFAAKFSFLVKKLMSTFSVFQCMLFKQLYFQSKDTECRFQRVKYGYFTGVIAVNVSISFSSSLHVSMDESVAHPLCLFSFVMSSLFLCLLFTHEVAPC